MTRPPTVCRANLLTTALTLATVTGYQRITREQIATHAGVSPASVSNILGTMVSLRRHVMRHAIATQCLAVIAQGLAACDPHALRAPLHLREAAAASLVRG